MQHASRCALLRECTDVEVVRRWAEELATRFSLVVSFAVNLGNFLNRQRLSFLPRELNLTDNFPFQTQMLTSVDILPWYN
jgi:hypothetical protein